MAERRRYTRRQKVTAVLAAEMTSQKAAAEATGIPRTTLHRWFEDPEMVTLRHNAREEMAGEVVVIARLIWLKLGEAVRDGLLEPDQLITAAGVATDKAQLLTGAATSRAENRTLSDGLDDHEKRQLRDALDRLLGSPAEASTGGAEVGTGAEVRE